MQGSTSGKDVPRSLSALRRRASLDSSWQPLFADGRRPSCHLQRLLLLNHALMRRQEFGVGEKHANPSCLTATTP
jgi:hypothetical protein